MIFVLNCKKKLNNFIFLNKSMAYLEACTVAIGQENILWKFEANWIKTLELSWQGIFAKIGQNRARLARRGAAKKMDFCSILFSSENLQKSKEKVRGWGGGTP